MISAKMKRELSSVLVAISDYRARKISLNALIQQVEAVRSVVENKAVRDALFSVVVELEQINASAPPPHQTFNSDVTAEIETYLGALEAMIKDRL